MDVLIRTMSANDWPAVAEIYRQGIETGKATFQVDVPAYTEWDAAHIRECRFVAVVEDKVAGWTALSKVSNRCVYAGVAELSLYIGENARGKGVGQKLLQHLIAESERAGFWTLQSGIMDDNLASIRLHEKCGFRQIGYRERIGRDVKGKWRNNILMEKRSQVAGIN